MCPFILWDTEEDSRRWMDGWRRKWQTKRFVRTITIPLHHYTVCGRITCMNFTNWIRVK
jgi:hypothetical protein